MKNRGITLLEIMISLSIIAVASALIWYSFSAFRDSGRLTETWSGVLGVLREARARTLAGQGNSNYGVHFEASKAVLFKGGAYNSSDPANESYLLPSSFEINSINLTGGAVDTVFVRLAGTTTTSGTVTVEAINNAALTKTITILSSGAIQ